MKERIDKMGFIKLYNIHSAKDTVKRMRKQATRWEKILPKDVSDKGRSSNSTIKNEQSNQLINGQKPVQTPHQKDIKIANKQTSLSYIISELKFKIRQHSTSVRMVKSRTLTRPNASKVVKQQEISFTADRKQRITRCTLYACWVSSGTCYVKWA